MDGRAKNVCNCNMFSPGYTTVVWADHARYIHRWVYSATCKSQGHETLGEGVFCDMMYASDSCQYWPVCCKYFMQHTYMYVPSKYIRISMKCSYQTKQLVCSVDVKCGAVGLAVLGLVLWSTLALWQHQ